MKKLDHRAGAPRFIAAFMAPRHWLSWLGVGSLWLLCLLPMPIIVGFGERLGWLVGRVMKRRRHITRVNLRMCFPHQSVAAREKMIDEHFAALGAGVFETGLAAFASDRRLLKFGRLNGIEHLDAAMHDGHGVLLLTGHFTTLNIGARYLCISKRPFHAMYRPLNNEIFDYCMRKWWERRSLLPSVSKSDLTKLVRGLRAGHCVWYGPDQSLDQRNATHVPFFGVPALTLTATSKLAQLGRAKVVPYFPARIDGRYQVTFLPALENFPGTCEIADASIVNRSLEHGIRMAPSQYFWSHRRFKHPPPGTSDPYLQ